MFVSSVMILWNYFLIFKFLMGFQIIRDLKIFYSKSLPRHFVSVMIKIILKGFQSCSISMMLSFEVWVWRN